MDDATTHQVLFPLIHGLEDQPSQKTACIASYTDLNEDHLDWLFACGTDVIGLTHICNAWKLAVIILSTESRCLLVTVPDRRPERSSILEDILSGEWCTKVGVDMDSTALLLFHELGRKQRQLYLAPWLIYC